MPYLNETGLAYYDPKLKEWISAQPVKTIPSSLYPWTLSEKADAVTCWPVGGTPLLLTVDFLFTETPPVGEKSPTNPSTITGVSSITVTRCETVGVDSTDYAIPLGNTYYGGSIDLATGVMTVTQFFHSFTGEESINVSDKGDGWSMFFYKPNDILPLVPSASSDKACTHFPFVYSANQQSLHWYVQSTGSLCMFSNSFAGKDAFKSWLASQDANGTPVQVTYQMSDPVIVQLTPTQILSLTQTDKYTPRLNTIYTDAQAVQVGYVKSPIREEFELQQAIVSQGGNI